MKLSRELMRKTLPRLLGALILLTVLSGCAPIIRLHPIDKVDIVSMPKGVSYTPEKDGWFLSTYYLEQVVKAKVEK